MIEIQTYQGLAEYSNMCIYLYEYKKEECMYMYYINVKGHESILTWD